jgi:hypothetical protein
LAGYDLEIEKDRLGGRLRYEVRSWCQPGKTETAGNGAFGQRIPGATAGRPLTPKGN